MIITNCWLYLQKWRNIGLVKYHKKFKKKTMISKSLTWFSVSLTDNKNSNLLLEFTWVRSNF